MVSSQGHVRIVLPALVVVLATVAATVGWATGVGEVEQAILIARFTARVSLASS